MNNYACKGYIPKAMKAIVLEHSCAPEEMRISEIPVPEAKPGWVLIKVHASGVNRSELILRASEIDEAYIKHPVVPGIECAGEVADPSDSDLVCGQRVVAIMGGMGRSFDGGYAEFCLVPRENVFVVESSLPWDELAAIPESWFTAWGSLNQSLQLKVGETLLIRGGTSALGIAALSLAKGMGAVVATTTRKPERGEQLYDWGADMVMLDDGSLREQMTDAFPDGIDCVLELTGPKTLLESLRFAAIHGRVCDTGVLGGVGILDGFDPIKDIPNGVYLTGFFSNYPTQRDVDDIFAFIQKHDVHPVIGAEFPLVEAGAAHRAIEDGEVFGKTILTMD